MNDVKNTFKYDNKTYTLNIILYTSTGDKSTDMRIAFDNNDVEVLEYSTKLNSLLAEGKVVYFDLFAMVDKFLSLHVCYCDIYFAEHKHPKSDDNGIGDPDPEKTILHTFLVSDIKLLEREGHRIKYEIDLVSVDVFKCLANVQYTNYDKGHLPVLEILKNCLATSGLAVDLDSFKKSSAPVSIPYATKLNDNMFSVSDFLMKNLYHMPLKDTSIKFFLLDLVDRKYKILDLRDVDTALSAYPTMLSMFKSNNEALVQLDPTNFGSFIDAPGKPEVYRTFFDKKIYGYSYEKNDFTMTDFSTAESLNYMNNKIDNSNYERKYYNIPSYPSLNFYLLGSYWNNHIDFYHMAMKMLEENTSLILNIGGLIKRQAGSCTSITLDRSIGNLPSDSKKDLEKEKYKYKNYEGLWYNSKVVNIVCPRDPSYRQKVVLFRNFVAKIKEPLA